MVADTQIYLSGTSGVSQPVSHPSCVVILTNFDIRFRSRQGVAKLCDMYTANCPIVYLTVPKLQVWCLAGPGELTNNYMN